MKAKPFKYYFVFEFKFKKQNSESKEQQEKNQEKASPVIKPIVRQNNNVINAIRY